MADMHDMITFTKVSLPHGWLSNMSPYSVQYGGHHWHTTEHLFQALRFPEFSPVRTEIRHQRSPMAAKMCAKKRSHLMSVNPHTDEDLENMRVVLQLKYDQHERIRKLLRETGDAELIEDVSRRPTESSLFWGVAHPRDENRRGKNWLGILWMGIRGRQKKNRGES